MKKRLSLRQCNKIASKRPERNFHAIRQSDGKYTLHSH